jgi:hypothetical protein
VRLGEYTVYEYNTCLIVNISTCGDEISEKLMLIALKGRGARNTARQKGGGVVRQGKSCVRTNYGTSINFI